MKYVCENCGHLFESRTENAEDRQCSKCRGHRVFSKKEARARILELKDKIHNLLNIGWNLRNDFS